MKRSYKYFCLVLCLASVLSLTACGGLGMAENPAAPDDTAAPEMLDAEVFAPADDPGGNILIVYFSRTGENKNVGFIDQGNTAILAGLLAEATGGDMFELVPETAYPEGFEDARNQAKAEKDTEARPAYTGDVANWDAYDVVFLGYPIWWEDMPMVIYTFLESHDFQGKTVIPFCTHEGSGLADTVGIIQRLCDRAEVLDGFEIPGQDVQTDPDAARMALWDWLGRLELSGLAS